VQTVEAPDRLPQLLGARRGHRAVTIAYGLPQSGPGARTPGSARRPQMSSIDELPPDQRAALSLLLRQHKSHEEVAQMLGIAPQAVHDRAHAALAVLAPAQARQLDAGQREEIG